MEMDMDMDMDRDAKFGKLDEYQTSPNKFPLGLIPF
jgi:hypothetical protein